MKIRGIAFKTFIFTATLIMLVSAATLGALYFIMPEYYRKAKEETMRARLESVAAAIEKTDDFVAARQLLADFCTDNNANVVTFIDEEQISADLTSPFVQFSIDGSLSSIFSIDYTESSFAFSDETSVIIPRDDGVALRAYTRSGSTPPFARVTGAGIPAEGGMNALPSAQSTGAAASTRGVIAISGEALPVETREAEPFGEGDETEPGMYKVLQATPVTISIASWPVEQRIVRAAVNSPFATALSVSYTLQPISEASGVILSLLPYILLMNVLIALAAAFFYSKMITKPILAISGAAEQMRELAPGAESAVQSNDELGTLSGNLNTLYSTLCTHIESLRNETERVTALEQSKTHFLRAAGHELKTPIAALNGIVEGMLDDVGVYKDKTKYLAESKKLLGGMAKTVNEILEATRHEALNPNDEPFCETDITALAKAVLADQQYKMEERGIRADIRAQGVWLQTRERAMRTVLSNVISNAVKYADAQSVIVLRTETANGGLRFVVENECAAIPEEHLSRLFEPFYSVNYSRDKQKSGTGIGLYIVKNNLDALGLCYGLENTETGVAFWVRVDGVLDC